MHEHRLDIAGHTITVRSQADPDYVQRLGRLIDARASGATTQGAGPVGAVLLAALALADEWIRAAEKLEVLSGETKTATHELLAMLESNG